MSLSFTKRRKIFFKRLKKIQYISLCRLFLAALPTVAFSVFTVVFTLQQDASAKAIREQDQQQADEINRRTIYKGYIDDITKILLARDYNTKMNKTFLHIRAQTLNVLQNLDVNRKRSIIVFLYENRLLRSDESPQVDLRGANLNGITFWSSSTVTCLLPFLYLPGVYLDNVIFDRCSLYGAVFNHASMSNAKFLTCSMSHTQFINTNLTEAQFHGNYLHDVNFSSSHFVHSSITGGSFRKIDLTNVDLYRSVVSEELLHPLKYIDKEQNIFLNTRYPNGSFIDINRQNLIVNGEEVLQCSCNNYFPERNISDDCQQKAINETSEMDNVCFFLTEKNENVIRKIDVQQFSLLIDLEKAMFNLSAFIGFKQPNTNEEISMIVQFIEDEGVTDNERSLTLLKKNVPLVQFEFLKNSIPAKTRSLLVWLVCNITIGINQFCVFDQVNLFISEKIF